ncbi:hypothetical protein B0A48_02501 [Cryoendolithus antarcticus]|uniref:Actin-like ATPase domain-containing protein n=1 Tax=Cryoendolithus antarcticus TaxID=1507870 RepID=A0A1V8TNT9_9PEZI|nr:hypothetical protein B0A48_02501 [Cryoendolithus antarcticus]
MDPPTSALPPPPTNGSTSPPPQETERERLIIAIDFGTTFSGVATALTSSPNTLTVINTWPGSNNLTSEKVPSEIAYILPPTGLQNGARNDVTPEQNPLAPVKRGIKWGYQFRPEEQRLRCIKLFLDRNQKLPSWVSPLETAGMLRKSDRTVIDGVADFLSVLWGHTNECLERRYGEAFMRDVEKEFVLTVPAVWSDSAKNATLQAAERAGMGTKSEIKLISEPEAAAVYALKMTPPKGLKRGDNIIVCDAGGGTVDLISYKVTSLNPLRVEESAVGSGGLCGSAFLNYRFADYIKARIGPQVFENMKEKKPKTWQMALKYFEEFVKRNFNEEEHSEVNVPLPGLPDDEEAGIDSGFLMMTAGEVAHIFEPVIKEVVALVRSQIDAVQSKGGLVSGIILVGGFGQSHHLYAQLKQTFNAAPPPPYSERPVHDNGVHQNIEVLQPQHAWTAVVRGAALRGIEGSMVERRRSRYAYGTSYATVFDAAKHPAADRYWSPLWERWMVSDRMQWHIAKGTPISAEEPISFHYTRNFRPGQSLVVEDDLIACEDETAPDAHVKELISVCKLTTDLGTVPRSLFTRLTTTKGVEFDNLDFELHMKIESADLVFELHVDGVKYGSVQADFAVSTV